MAIEESVNYYCDRTADLNAEIANLGNMLTASTVGDVDRVTKITMRLCEITTVLHGERRRVEALTAKPAPKAEGESK